MAKYEDEPMFPLERREELDYGPSWIVLGAAIAVSVIICTILLLLSA